MSDWPVERRGVTESVVTTLGPNDRWNVAALGLRADGERVTARTWGRTRTRRNFEREGEGYVQFTRDPVTFVDAALAVREVEDPILGDADAWVRVAPERVDSGLDGETEWVEWHLYPVESEVVREVVPTINRGRNAVVEATVWASRLDVPSYDRAELEARLDYLGNVVRTCGGDCEQAAWERIEELVEW